MSRTGRPVGATAGLEGAAVDLYWLPLGAGGHSVRLNGRIFEAIAARRERRPACDLYHSALVVYVPEGRFVIEQAPIRDDNGANRGVVAMGAVGCGWAGRFRLFRYEVRRWRDGVITPTPARAYVRFMPGALLLFPEDDHDPVERQVRPEHRERRRSDLPLDAVETLDPQPRVSGASLVESDVTR